MTELIVTIILFGSLLGMGIMILRKTPILSSLPEVSKESLQETFGMKLKKRVRDFQPFKFFSFEIFLQKILSKIRILTLKVENKIGNQLQKLREKAKKKNSGTDNYWQEIKKTKNQEDKQEGEED